MVVDELFIRDDGVIVLLLLKRRNYALSVKVNSGKAVGICE